MYLARRNIRIRNSLVQHTAAFFASFIGLLIFTDGFWRVDAGPFIGFYFAWLLLIVYKACVVARSRLEGRSPKADPVKLEYDRLRSMPSEKIANEYR